MVVDHHALIVPALGIHVVGWTVAYTGLVVVAGLVTAALALIGARFRSASGSEWFAGAMGLSALWSFCALAVVLGEDPTTLAFAEVVMTGCSLTVPVTWFLFVVSYVGFDRSLDRWRVASLFALPLLALLAMAMSPMTSLYFADATLVTGVGGVITLQTYAGPLAWALLLYVLGLLAIGVGLIAHATVMRNNLFSAQGAWLLVGMVPPTVTNLSGSLLFSGSHLPLAPLGFALMGVVYGYGLFYHDLLRLSPGTWRIGTDAAFDSLSEGFVIVDNHGHIVEYNRQTREFFGWDEAAAFGRDIATVEPSLAAARENEEAVEFSRDNRRYEVTVSRIADATSRRFGELFLVRDVTGRYERRQQLAVLNRILRHNLRNDLMVVRSRATELDERYEDDLAGTIVDTADDLITMAEKARSIEGQTGRENLDRRAVEIEPLLGDAIEAAQTAAGSVPVETELPSETTVWTDPGLLDIVLTQLIENAIEHGCSEPDGSPTEDRSPVRVVVERTADGLTIEVSDDGPGIPESQLQVLERSTETPVEHGLGLGLWLVTWGASWLDADLTFDTSDGTTARLIVPES